MPSPDGVQIGRAGTVPMKSRAVDSPHLIPGCREAPVRRVVEGQAVPIEMAARSLPGGPAGPGPRVRCCEPDQACDCDQSCDGGEHRATSPHPDARYCRAGIEALTFLLPRFGLTIPGRVLRASILGPVHRSLLRWIQSCT